MGQCGNCLNTVAWYVFDYSTPKVVTVRSFSIGLLSRLIQLLIIAYVVGYVIVYNKGYQSRDEAESSVTCKVKGIASTLERNSLPDHYRRIWDTADYVVPPQENNALFVMTNAIITPSQSKGVCSEDNSSTEYACNSTYIPSLCSEGSRTANGVATGKCEAENSTCAIHAWCPVEQDKLEPELRSTPLLPDAENFTILVKNFVEFPKFGVKRRNIIDSVSNRSYLSNCHYNRIHDPFCPVFRIGDIIDNLPASTNFKTVATSGGVIVINIKWDCDLDHDLSRCNPSYDFRRLDRESTPIAPGWNFRFSKEYRVNGTLFRDLYKAYGILFVFSVQGVAGKFDAIPLFMTIGSGLALLSITTVLCDAVMLYVHKNKRFYKRKKYLNLVDDEFNEIASSKLEDDEFESINPD